MNLPSRTLLALAALCVTATAQDAPRQALDAASNIYLGGDYAAAVAAFEKVLTDYPTSPVVPNAQLQLAFAYHLTGENQKSLDMLKKFQDGPSAGPELTELAAILQPQAMAGLANALKSGDPARKSGFTEASKKFGEFIQKYPQSAELESAYYGSALASFQAGDYAGAKTALEANIKKFPNTPGIDESRNLLALIYATEGSQMLSQEGADRDAGFALYGESAKILRDIINRKSDLALVNSAQFQLGEILLNEAAFAPDDRKPALLEEARNAFRGVLPKESILELQQKKIDAIPALRAAALRARNDAERNRIDRQAERDRRKLAELQARPDQTVTALQKVGESYFQQGGYDESRVVLSHVQPLLTDDGDKKRNLYYTAMTYALQNAAEQATSRYEEFQRSHKGDPIAANLPVALGNMFLTHPDASVRNPEKAAEYFKEAAEIYPGSPLLGLAVVNEATARAQQGDFEGALKTYRDFLATNPPPEVAAVAQLGIGNVFKEQGKWDEAIAAFKDLVQKFPKSAQVEEAEFWVAAGTQQKGDNEGAIPLVEAFVTKYPATSLTPSALYAKGAALIALGRTDDGIAAFAEIAGKFPKSQPAPFTYFDRARLAAAAQNSDEVVRLMREFIGKYPGDEKVFFAYDSIGQTETSRANFDAAIDAYESFVTAHADSPKAPEAMLKIADLHRIAAERLGRYGALGPEDQEKWKASIDASIAASEKMASSYPDSPSLSLGLRALLAAKQMQLEAGLTDDAGVEKYFEDLAAKAPESAKTKVLFVRAAFINIKDPSRALGEMNKAYDTSVVYAPADLDIYGLALLDGGKTDEARAVFEKIAADYPNPEGAAPQQAPPSIQEAQATALFGLGRVAQEKGDTADAGRIFEQLKTLYPWSPKVLEANYGIAASLREQGKGDEAVALLTQIIRAPNASSQLRADSMLLGGYIQKDKGERDAAIDYFIKISAFYDGVPEAASTGLWEGAQLLEQQVNDLQGSDPEKAKKQRAQLVRALQELVQKFPDSKFAPQAKDKLNALGGQ
ncbi:MAG: tetratricopeptide repeat protein [Chthoniobacterales bacterium]|nr:tetratricopeptide repeat protein [Chthoniobacterales bacterium]